jgi:predicted amidophosphoribosyltransferase
MIGAQSSAKEYYEKFLRFRKQDYSQSGSESFTQESLSGNDTFIQPVKSPEIICPYCGGEFQGRNVEYCPDCGRGLVDGSPRNTFSYNSPRNNRALVKCPDCGKEISPEAESCPNCGKPSSILHCPVCKSTNVTKLSSGAVAMQAWSNILMAGPFARRAKLYTCNKCKHSW